MTFSDDLEYGVRHPRKDGKTVIYECDREYAEMLYNSKPHGKYFVVVSRPKTKWNDSTKVEW